LHIKVQSSKAWAATGGCWRTLPRAVRQQFVKSAEHWNGLLKPISWIMRAQKERKGEDSTGVALPWENWRKGRQKTVLVLPYHEKTEASPEWVPAIWTFGHLYRLAVNRNHPRGSFTYSTPVNKHCY